MDGNTRKPTAKRIKGIIAAVGLVTILVESVLCLSRGKRADAAGSSEIVMEQSTCRVLKGCNIDMELPMASTTKIMTAITVIENCNMDDTVVIPRCAQGVEGSSVYINEGEKYTVKELLFGLMLRSGNDCAVALAVHTAGSVEAFAKLMNEMTAELGLKHTHFINPHGLQASGHYTSAYDLAVISCYAMNNALFKEIVSTKRTDIGEGETAKTLVNKNKLLYSYPDANGIKTGYTVAAGRCLVAASERNGMQVVAVVLNCRPMYEECQNLMNYAHENYKMTLVASKDAKIKEVAVKNGVSSSAGIGATRDLYVPLKEGEKLTVKSVPIADILIAPVEKGENAGKMEIYVDNRLLFSENLYTINKIEKESIRKRFFDFFK